MALHGWRRVQVAPSAEPGAARDAADRCRTEPGVDGGSEFAAEFEAACLQKELPLFVLPPQSPRLNAHVERSNRTHNEEFYEVQAESDQVPVLNRQLQAWEKACNCVRPHQSLPYLTLLEFITRWKPNQRKAKCH